MVILLGVVPGILSAQSSFPVNTLDNQGLTWTTGGSAAWVTDSSTKVDLTSARSGAIPNEGITWIETSILGPGEISFSWSVSSEPNYDYLTLRVDGQSVESISGFQGWRQVTKTITKTGPVTIRFEYRKDGSQSSGQDAGWVDRFTLFSAARVSEAMNGFVGLPYRIATETQRWPYWNWAYGDQRGVIVPWTVDPLNSQSGSGSSLRSGVTEDYAASAVELPGVPGGQTVSWYVKTRSEWLGDVFTFHVNGDPIYGTQLSGFNDWTFQSYTLPPGQHTLQWVYRKDDAWSQLSDAVWVDSVSLAYPPVLVTNPTGGTFSPGSTLRLSAAGGGGTGTTVTWRRGGVALTNGGRISGADTLNLVVNTLGQADDGGYTVTLSNAFGTVTSPVATVTVPIPPAITTAPSGVTVNLSQSFELSVAASGSPPLAYQWRRGGVDIPGAVASTYRVTSATVADGGTYTVRVSNAHGDVTSSGATVVVIVAPTITTQPVPTTAALGKTATFSVAARSSQQPITYRWRRGGVNLADGARVSGSTSAQLTLSALEAGDAGQYSVVVGNASGTVTSDSAALILGPFNLAPTLNAISDVTRAEDSAATTVNLGGISDGNGNTQTLTVTATSSDPSVVPDPGVTYVAGQSTGSLSIGNTPGKSGRVTITVRIRDNGGTVSGGVDVAERQFSVTVTPVNDPPVMATATFPTLYDRRQPMVLAQDFAVDAAGGVLRGSAARVTDPSGRLLLTPSVAAAQGSFSLDALHPSEAPAGFRARFRLWAADVVNATGTTPPSEVTGLSLNLMPEDPALVGLANAGRGVGTGLSVGFVPVSGPGGLVPHVVLRAGGVEIARTNYSILGKGTAAEPPWVEVVMTADRQVSVSHHGTVLFHSVPTTLNPRPGWQFLWVASNGSGNTGPRAAQFIDDLLVASLPVSRVAPVVTQPSQTPANVLSPSDPIVATSANSPANEGVAMAIDGSNQTKYLSFDKVNAGFTVTPRSGASVVTALALTTANDSPERDPASWTLQGSINGIDYETIATGSMAANPTRFRTETFPFANAKAYTSYRMAFPTVANAAGGNSMQVAEVALLGFQALSVPLSGLGDGDSGSQALTLTATSSNPLLIGTPQVLYTRPQTTATVLLPQPPVGASGTAVISVRVRDDGGTANGGNDTATFQHDLRIVQVNQPPRIDPVSNISLDTTAAAATQTVPLTGLGAGDDVLARDLTVTAVSSVPDLIPNPVVTYTSPSGTGSLVVTVPQGRTATATVTVTVRDSAGTANGGADSAFRTFTVRAGVQPPTVETPPESQIARVGDEVVFRVGATGVGLTYSWFKGSERITGIATPTLTLTGVTAADASQYSVRVENASGSSVWAATLSVVSPPVSTAVKPTQRASLTGAVSLAPLVTATYVWLKDGQAIAGANQVAYTIGSATTDSVGSYVFRVIAGGRVFDCPPVTLRLISPVAGLFGTGLDDQRMRLADRAADPHYVLVAPSPVTGSPVAVTGDGSFPIPPWIAGDANSAWISPSARLREAGSSAGTLYTYRTTFDLTGVQLSTVRIAGRVAADDALTAIRLNGQELQLPSDTGPGAFRTFDFRPSSTRGQDRFVDRGTLVGVIASGTSDTTGAGRDAGEPSLYPTGTHGSGASVWWRWVAPQGGTVTLSTTGSSIPTMLAAFEGSQIDRLTLLAKTDGAGQGANVERTVSFRAVAGREYAFALAGYQTSRGAVALGLRMAGSTSAPTPALGTLNQGLNTLDFVVRNSADAGLDRGLTGLRVDFTDTEAVVNPVEIVAAPTGGTEVFGGRKTFSVGTITSGPTTYQWHRDGVAIPGADEPELVYNVLEEADGGSYRVRVSNANGVVWSDPVEFKVDLPLAFTRQPADTVVGVGQTAVFSVRFRGNAPLGVQWYFNDVLIPGAVSTNLTLPNVSVSRAGRYRALARDRDGALSSGDAVLTVVEPPLLVQEPQDFQGVAGRSRLQLQAIVDGSDPKIHRWFRNGVPLAVADSPVLDLGLLRESQAGTYQLVVTNLAGAATSRSVVVSVHLPPSLSASTGNVKAYEGETGQFSVTAAGSGQLEYRWFAGTTELVGQNGSSLALEQLTRSHAGQISVVVANPFGSLTNTYQLEVYPAPVPVVSTGTNLVQTFVLKPGWNALFLEVQPEDNAVQSVLAGIPFGSLWRWSDPRTGPQFISDQTEAVLDKARWQIHLPTSRPESFQNNLVRVFRHEAYLLRLDSATEVTLQVRGKPGHARPRWATDAYTLTGFMVDDTVPAGATAGTDLRPTVEQFLGPSIAHFDRQTGQPRGVYRLAPDGTWSLLRATDRLTRGEAYWVYTKGTSDYLAPVEAVLPGLDELRFPYGIATREITLRFRTNSFSAVLGHHLDAQSLPLQVNEFDPGTVGAWRDLPNGYGVESRGMSTRAIRLAAKRERIPDLHYGGILTLRGGGALHRIPVTVERDDPVARPESGVPFNPVGLWLGSISVTHVSEVNGLTTNYVVTTTTNVVDGKTNLVDRATTEVRNVVQGSLPTPVRDPFEMRLILHSGADGATRILQQVTVMNRPPVNSVDVDGRSRITGGEAVLLTDSTRISKFNGVALRGRDSVGRRFSTPFFPMYQTNGIPFDGTLGLGRRINARWSLPADAPLNPFRHKYHPDHDNLDPSFKVFRQEAFPVRRSVQLEIPERQGSGQSPGRGQDEIEGVFTETLEGLHRVPITVRGTFTLKRLLPVADLDPE